MSDRVLLVDDHPALRAEYEHAFGHRLDYCRSVPQVGDLIREGIHWKAAFIDYDLGLGRPTGLQAAMQIREYSPTTRLIACTSLGDGSRMLFSIAMWHWLGSREVMDKQDVERSYLKRVVDQGEHATSPARAKDLQRGASHIDGLFRSPIWLDCWKAWPDTRGKLAQAKLYLKPLRASQVGLFHNEAGQAITDLVDSVAMGYFPERNSEGYNTSSDFVVSFAMMNRAFFYDEALPVLLEAKKPWTKFALSDPVRRPKSR